MAGISGIGGTAAGAAGGAALADVPVTALLTAATTPSTSNRPMIRIARSLTLISGPTTNRRAVARSRLPLTNRQYRIYTTRKRAGHRRQHRPCGQSARAHWATAGEAAGRRQQQNGL